MRVVSFSIWSFLYYARIHKTEDWFLPVIVPFSYVAKLNEAEILLRKKNEVSFLRMESVVAGVSKQKTRAQLLVPHFDILQTHCQELLSRNRLWYTP